MSFQPGDVVAHYRLLEPLGAGGMGVIFKGRDLRLDRVVALKFLPPGVGSRDPLAERLIQEAKVASALDHPNICTIFGIEETETGAAFIVMAYYPGTTLRQRLDRGPLPLNEALDLALQLCDGLSRAHARGIVHRDIKPDNLILTEDGVLKILDFGISRLQGAPGLTQPGTILGTPAYMSPEQVKGESADHRADIWAAGVVLYAMLTAQLPFKGPDQVSMMYSIVNDPPRPITDYRPGLPLALSSVLAKALAKQRDIRYPSIGELAGDLRSLAPGGPVMSSASESPPVSGPSDFSIAVLPFKDLSPAQDQGYLCEGLAEAVITNLGQIPELRVISPTSVFRFQGGRGDWSELARTLNVRNALDGSLQRIDNRLRVSVRLVDLADGSVLWTDRLQEELRDLFAVQDRISERVAAALRPRVGAAPTLRTVPPARGPGFEAYQMYLRGRFHWNRRTVDEVKKSIQCFTEAIDLDSRFGLAFAGLADAYTVLGMYGAFPPSEAMPQARDAAGRAVELDDSLAEAHVSLGCVKSVYDWDWPAAEAHFRRSIQLNPSYALGHHWFAVNCLAPLGRFDEARRETEEALRLDPISPVIVTSAGLPFYFSGDFEPAVSRYRTALELDSGFAMAHFFMAQALAQQSCHEEALESYRAALRLYGDSANMKAHFGFASARAGDRETARRILAELSGDTGRYVSAYDLATLAVGLGETALARRYLEAALEERSYLLVYLKHDPVFAGFREEAWFVAALERLFGSVDTLAGRG